MADVEINLESTDPKELMRCGHHAFVIKDYSNAAAALGKASQLLAQEHGDEHDSLGEVYLHYGRALLEVSRDESEPLGDAIPHGDSDSDSSDDANGVENEGENEAENEENAANEEKEDKEVEQNGKSEEKSEVNGKDEKTKEDEADGVSSSSANGQAAASSSETAPPGESTEETSDKGEPSDLQLAWEVLEVAKKIFTARGDTGKELLSQALILLGEVSMESENFADAVKDIQAGLEIQESLYEKTSRKLAETQYKLGIANATLSNIEDAVKYFEMSILTLSERITLLKEKDDENSKKEIVEIEELIPEIKEKVNDTKSIKDETVKLIMEMSSAPKLEQPETSEPSKSTKEVKDISHLVKRKRKIEDIPALNENQPTKKPTP